LSYSFTVSKGLPCASVLNGLLHRFSVVANYDMMSGDHLAVSSEYQVDRRTISFPFLRRPRNFDAMAEPCQQPGRTRMGKTKEQGVNGISDSSSIAVRDIRLQCPAPLSGFPL
jgi:hypothetical protein